MWRKVLLSKQTQQYSKRNLKITTLAEVAGGWSHSCCVVLWDPEWKTRLKCTLLSQGQKKERSDEIMIRKGKINELLASLRAGCAGFMNVRTYSWPYTGICEKCASVASLRAYPVRRSECGEIQRTWHVLQEGMRDWPHLSGGLRVHCSWLKDQQGQRLPWM